MNTIIAFLLVLIAVLLFTQKPLKIEIKHTYPEPPQMELQSMDDVDNQDVVNMDSLINALHNIMGVDSDE